ncbi:MAG: hypothetical protein AAGF92_02775 [Myxococcota bacterium]
MASLVGVAEGALAQGVHRSPHVQIEASREDPDETADLEVEETAKGMHRSPHIEEETANIVGIKGGFVSVFSGGEYVPGGNVGPFYERNVIPGWLELEAAIAVTFVEDETVLGFDLFAKKPFHVNEQVNPYVGLGPNASIIFSPESTVTRFGILMVGGSYFWLGHDHQWGFDVELVYLLLFDSDLTHELTLEVGPAFRF